jgi:hypothetical protein
MCFSSAEGTSDFRRGWLLKRALKWKTVLAMQQPEAARHFFIYSFGQASASSSFILIQLYDLLLLPIIWGSYRDTSIGNNYSNNY